MDNKDVLDFIEQNNIQNHEKENKDVLYAARWAFVALIIIELIFTFIKLHLNQNYAENMGAVFITVGVFDLMQYKYQRKKLNLVTGIISLFAGIVFSLGYIGMILR